MPRRERAPAVALHGRRVGLQAHAGHVGTATRHERAPHTLTAMHVLLEHVRLPRIVAAVTTHDPLLTERVDPMLEPGPGRPR